MDHLSKGMRSKNMSNIRGKWTSPERVIHNQLKGLKIRHKMHPDVYGKPDIFLASSKTLVFLDGCFWHGCSSCSHKKPSTNAKFWKDKIKRNIRRDKEVSLRLKKEGFKIIRLWEHDIKKNFPELINKMKVMV